MIGYWLLGIGIVLFGGIIFYLLNRGRRRSDEMYSEIGASQQRFLLFLLRRSQAGFTVDQLEAAARSAWKDRFGLNHDGTNFVDSGSAGAGFVIQAHGNALLVVELGRTERNLKAPLVAYPASAIEIWSHYTHDVSVGIVYNYDTETNRLSAFVGRLAAALVDSETLGLFHTASGRLWRADDDTIERLKTTPQEFFGLEADH